MVERSADASAKSFSFPLTTLVLLHPLREDTTLK